MEGFFATPQEETKILFKDLIKSHKAAILSYMGWENYTLNSTTLIVTELVKEHAFKVLLNSYGKFKVRSDILEELFADVFIYFPVLLQHLSITRLIDALGVVRDDINTTTTTRTESLSNNETKNSTLTQGTTQSDVNVLNTTQRSTGTVGVAGEATNNQAIEVNITNSSNILSTGSKSVSLSHALPEQGLSGLTGNFPVDGQGTPILNASFVQEAQENFATNNPVNTSESSSQTTTTTNTTVSSNTTTNNLSVADTGSTSRNIINSGSDTTVDRVEAEGLNSVTERTESVLTNKQYALEVRTFLETADALIAFSKWEDRFSWVVGVV